MEHCKSLKCPSLHLALSLFTALYLFSFFNQMDTILSASYTPSQDDVLRSRVQTTGIIETAFRVGKLTYRYSVCTPL